MGFKRSVGWTAAAVGLSVICGATGAVIVLQGANTVRELNAWIPAIAAIVAASLTPYVAEVLREKWYVGRFAITCEHGVPWYAVTDADVEIPRPRPLPGP